MMNLKVHLVFPGTCEKALNRYKEVLGGRVDFLFRKKEDKSMTISEEDKVKISHMVVKTPNFEIAGEDANHDVSVHEGNNTKLVLSFQGVEEAKKVFESLTRNGKVMMSFEKTFFTDGIGEVIDEFGIWWIVMVTDEGYQA